MKKCILIPDSFKGTMSSIEICCILSSKIKKYYPDCQIISIPAADGGEARPFKGLAPEPGDDREEAR